MYTWKRLKDGRSIVIDSKGDSTTEAWYVAGASPDAARADTNPEKPEYLQVHPDNAGLVCTNIGYAHWIGGTRCEAKYVPQEYVHQEPESQDDPDFINGDGHTVKIQRNLPVYERVLQKMQDSQTPNVKIWQPLAADLIAPFEYSATEFSIEIIANIQSQPNVDVMLFLLNQIAEEDGKIHRINGRDYLFGCEGTERVSRDQYRMIYTWRSDPGIPLLLEFDGTPFDHWGLVKGYWYGFAGNIDGVDWLIPPFSRLNVGPTLVDDVADPTQMPQLGVSPLYKRNDNGWQTLPGIAP